MSRLTCTRMDIAPPSGPVIATRFDWVTLDTPGRTSSSFAFARSICWHQETQWLLNHRCAAYIVIYIQFLQLIFYFSAHPKMAVLTETVAKAGRISMDQTEFVPRKGDVRGQ
eukprot:4373217-Amphidinium_carterae.4